MEWLEFKPWSVEVKRKLTSLAEVSAGHSEGADVLPFRPARRPVQGWATLLQQWPTDSLWGQWTDVEN
jgi:hypothetical protein